MKTLSLSLLLSLFLLISCKKENHEAVISHDAELAAVNAKLVGTWTVAGIPKNSLSPYSASVVFDKASTVAFTDFEGNSSQRTYSLAYDKGSTYININADLIRQCKIIALTADTLKIQSTLNTSDAVTIPQTFVRANATDIAGKIFRLNVTPFNGGTNILFDLNIKLNIYITPKNGSEKLVVSQTINQPYTYTYTPSIGDHIRIAAISVTDPGNPATFTCLAMYKGVPIGKDWKSTLFSSLPEKGWDIVN